MEQSKRIKISGKIRIEHSNGSVWESRNFVVNSGIGFVGSMLAGEKTGKIYRIAIGDGGVVGGNRILPDDSWYTKTGLVSPRYSNDIQSYNVMHDGKTTSLYFQHTFTGLDHTTDMANASEMGLIIGSGSSGILQGGNDVIIPPPNDVLFAYRTFNELPLPAGDPGATITVHWTIIVENS